MNRREQPPAPAPHKSPTLEEEEDAISSSSEESDAEEDTADRKALRFKRFGRFSTQRPGLRDDEDDEDDSPAFLPLSRESEQPHESSRQDLNATLRLDQQPGVPRRRQSEQKPEPKKSATESSASSASSGVPVSVAESEERRRKTKLPAGLSPRRAAEIAGVSPRRSTASGKSASDDTPSMGSSFSDLDDASVSQSALEEALMSNMQHGGMASRMSTISQALRSRYL
ncbi:hypothetical protein PHISP_04904 [Aspergillus sp. HF37]|nr:hypothetical protein PHISP_04904 [Aspergillus sp. HF37]